MKKREVQITLENESRAIPGYSTDTPGLVVASFNPGEKKSDARWMLFHERSGKHLKSFRTRKEAGDAAAWIASCTDWTLDEGELDPQGLLDASKRLYGQHPSTEGTQDAGITHPSGVAENVVIG